MVGGRSMDAIDSLAEVKNKQNLGGGEEKVEMQRNLGKLTARERIFKLLDNGSFIEVGALLGENGAGVITGHGTIEGRLVYVYSQDYTVDGGALTIENAEKICRIMNMALEMGAPLVQIHDSIGAKISQGMKVLESYGKILNMNSKLTGVVPQISIVAGPAMGLAAISATMSDFTIGVEKVGQLGINSPEKLTQSENNYVKVEKYATAEEMAKSGNVHISAEGEEEAVSIARNIFGYIPSNNTGATPLGEESADLNIANEKLDALANEGNVSFDNIIGEIADLKSVVELNKGWEEATATALIKINGVAIGVMGTRSTDSAQMTTASIDKLTRFVRMCDSYNIPIISLVNNKGFVCDLEEENNGLALYASKLVNALSSAKVGKVALIVGEAYGAGYSLFASKELSFDITYAWPSAKVCFTNPSDLIKATYKQEILEQEDPKTAEEKVINKYMDEVTKPYQAAYAGAIDDIIKPAETKARLFATVDMLYTKKVLGYAKRQGSNLI